MKKKLSVILLALVLVFAIAACGNDTTPDVPDPAPAAPAPDIAPDTDDNPEAMAFEAYSEIMQLLSLEAGDSGAFDIDFVMEMDMDFMGESISSVSTGNMQMIVDGDNVRMAMVMGTDMAELGLESMNMEMLMVVEGNVATELRMSINGDDFSEMFPPEMLEDMIEGMLDDAFNMPEFGIEALRSAEIEQAGGNTEIHMVLDGQLLGDFVSSVMEDSLAMLGGLELGMNFDISDVIMDIVVDNAGNPLTMTMEMEMQMGFGDDLAEELEELAGEEMSIRLVSTYIFNAFGDNVEAIVF